MGRLLLAGLVSALALPPAADPRSDLYQEVNRRRREAGAVEMTLAAALYAVAQERAHALAVRGSLEPTIDDLSAVTQALRRGRYRAFRWQEATIHGHEDPSAALDALRREQPEVYTALTTGDYLEAGVGRSLLRARPLWLVLVALPQQVATQRDLQRLADLAAVRFGVLAATNAARAEHGRPPLVSSEPLDRVAQSYAEAMRDGPFYAHVDPRGRDVRRRLEEAGYRAPTVAENLARGFFAPAEVVERWMLSEGHRANLLSPLLTELGVGVAYDPSGARGEDVYWVQNFGSTAPAGPP